MRIPAMTIIITRTATVLAKMDRAGDGVIKAIVL